MLTEYFVFFFRKKLLLDQLLLKPACFILGYLHSDMFKRIVSEFILAKGHFRLAPSLSFKARLSWYENDFFFQANKTHFYKKGFALSRVSKVGDFGTRKWPISHAHNFS